VKIRSVPVSLCVLTLLGAACRQAPPPARAHNVVLVVVDTLRADRLGCYGNPRGLTPFLDELAGRGVRFANAYAPSSWTVPSIASLFTSRYPSQHQVNSFDAKLADSEVTLAERLSAGGYAPAGFSANFRLTSELGFAQGFHHWGLFDPTGHKTRGSELRDPVVGWLNANSGELARPWVLYLQYMEPHAPYEPPEPYRTRYAGAELAAADAAAANLKMEKANFPAVSDAELALLGSLYDGEVASVDQELRDLFAILERQNLLRDAVVIITADHGEEFREHGGLSHGYTLYNDNIRVPLIIVAPGAQAGRVVQANVSLLDLAPTLLELLGLPPEPRFEGRSLAAQLHGPSASERLFGAGDGTDRSVLSELLPTGNPFDLRRHRQALVRGELKLVVPLAGPAEAYDLANDPGERAPNRPAVVAQAPPLVGALLATTAALQARAASTPQRVPVDAATQERLRALGYRF
jgi:arylsulfatase A-like enzyme